MKTNSESKFGEVQHLFPAAGVCSLGVKLVSAKVLVSLPESDLSLAESDLPTFVLMKGLMFKYGILAHFARNHPTYSASSCLATE